MATVTEPSIDQMKTLSPRRNSTTAQSVEELVNEQLEHFGISPDDEYGDAMRRVVQRMYESQADIQQLWQATLQTMNQLDQEDKIRRFNAKKFLSFQLAKLLDTLQHPFRKTYQSLGYASGTQTAKGAYPVFDNVTALFSATPVITRTATYIYACAEWIADAFRGKELMLEIYSRLLNPTSICLANHIVDLEAGPYAADYFAWNFNSGMAAIDAVLAHVLGRDDVIITSRNIYGGAYQLIHDWYAKEGNLEVSVETFDGYHEQDFAACLAEVKEKYADRLAAGRKVYLYLESPCNPHGYVLDIAAICRHAHAEGVTVMLDATVGTPFLYRPLQRDNLDERPDYVIHSYTKDLSGTGGAIAGCVIGRTENMFLPKGEELNGRQWEDTMFWNVYYVKGAFLNADAAFEVMQGMKTLNLRMLRKCTNTLILTRFLNSHPNVTVFSNALDNDPNSELRKTNLYLGLPAPLFTIDMGDVPTDPFRRFFDRLSPTFGHMISLGQSNTIISCPALTTHSELDEAALRAAGMSPTTIRFAMGDEDPLDLIEHLIFTARATIDESVPGFSDQFLSFEDAKKLIRDTTMEVQSKYVDSELAGRRGY